MKLVVDAATDKILGAHMLGEDAPEIMQGDCGGDYRRRDKSRFRPDDRDTSDRGGGIRYLADTD